MDTPTKESLAQDLQASTIRMINWVNEQPEDRFNQVIIPEKWTIAGHLYHLIKTTKATTKGLIMPKIGLRTMFGKSNRPERTYEQMVQKYEAALATGNIKAPAAYEAEAGREFDRDSLLKRYQGEMEAFNKAFAKWKEADLSVYIMPHPAIGKCTLREFGYFTILHNEHHLRILREQYG